MSEAPPETIFLQQAVRRGLLSLEQGRQIVDEGRRRAARGQAVDVLALARQLAPGRGQELQGLLDEVRRPPSPSVPRTQRLDRPPEFGAPGAPAEVERTAEMTRPPQFAPPMLAAIEAPTPTAPTPTRIENYDILRTLGTGANGTVFQARHIYAGNEVALKLLHEGADEQQKQRFFREAKAATTLRHPSLVSVLDLGLHGDIPYLVMELAPGRTLAALLAAEGPLDARRAAIYATQIAQGLIYAHATLLHRDIKPENILIVDQQARLTDFGLVHQVKTSNRLTSFGDLLGSPAYMAPEQARGETELDARVDVYGLGATLYEMLTARAPFTGTSLNEVLLAVIDQPPAAPSSVVPGVDPRLEAICLRCLAKDPGQRFPNAKALADALAGFLTG